MTALILYEGTALDTVDTVDDRDIDPEILERKLAALKGQEETIRSDIDEMLRDLNSNCVDLQLRIADLNGQLAELMINQPEEDTASPETDSEDLPEEFKKTNNKKKSSKEAVVLFRRIAKLTHPDSTGNNSKVEIFHLALKRYKEDDVEGLRRILKNILHNSTLTKLIDNVIEELLNEISTKEAAIQDLKASEEYELLKQYMSNPKQAYMAYRSFKMMQIRSLLQEIGTRSKTDMLTPVIIVDGKRFKVVGLENVKDSKTNGNACRLKMSEEDAHGLVREHMLVEGALNITVIDLNGESKLKSVLREFSAEDNTVVIYLMRLGE